jgi:hypothetical protein
MISLNPGFSALALGNSSQLFQFSVKLLNFPSIGAHIFNVIRRRLRNIVGSDIFRVAVRGNYPE